MTRTPKTSNADLPRESAIDMADFARDIARRRKAYEAKYGPLEIPRNAGNRRTASKRALLKAIEALAERVLCISNNVREAAE